MVFQKSPNLQRLKLYMHLSFKKYKNLKDFFDFCDFKHCVTNSFFSYNWSSLSLTGIHRS